MPEAPETLRTTLARLSRKEQRHLGYLLAPLGVALVSLVIAAVRTRAQIPNISILYLLIVLALASTVGRRPAILASVLAFLAYDFLFVEPVYTFTVADPDEWLALLVFLLTALVAGQLPLQSRRRPLPLSAPAAAGCLAAQPAGAGRGQARPGL